MQSCGWRERRRSAAQKRFDGFRVTVIIKPADKADRISTLTAVMIEPFTATDGHAVISIEPLIPARRKEFFSSLAEELFQIHFSCSLFLLIGEMNILSHSTSFPLHRWPILPSLLLMIIRFMPKGKSLGHQLFPALGINSKAQRTSRCHCIVTENLAHVIEETSYRSDYRRVVVVHCR